MLKSENKVGSIELLEQHLKSQQFFKTFLNFLNVVLYNNTCVTNKGLKQATGCSSAWLERLVWDQEVAGSNPVTPIEHAGVVQW